MGKLWEIKCKIYNVCNDMIVKKKQKGIEKRIGEKWRKGEKINVVFVCHRPAIWGALKSIFQAMETDSNYNVTIVAIPNKKEDAEKYFYHEEYISEGAEEFFGALYAHVIKGYDYVNKVWVDLRELKPDYVFFQTPYNICRPMMYNSVQVAKYAKLCYVHYGYGNMDFPSLGTSPLDFMKCITFLFPDTKEKEIFWYEILEKKSLMSNRILAYCGYPKFDEYYEQLQKISDPWNYKGKERKKLRILWTPRWTEEENNSHFNEYKEFFLDYALQNPDMEIWFRPHPQMVSNMQGDGEWEGYVSKIHEVENFFIDKKNEYFDTFIYSDVLVSDVSGMLAEYMPTGKPIILCARKLNFNRTGEKLASGYYFAYSWKDVEDKIEMLNRGEDPLKGIRDKVIKEELLIDVKEKSGDKIKKVIDSAYCN